MFSSRAVPVVAIGLLALAMILSAWFYIDFSTSHDLAEPSVLAWFTDVRGLVGSALGLVGAYLFYRGSRTRN